MLLLRNPVQPYAWGSVDGLAAIVGSEPSGGPEAELWVGTHPLAPSVVADDPRGRTLAEVIADDPVRWLGADLAAKGHVALPFLLKVLAVGRPLSLQAHPSAAQAEAGFAREEAAGIPRHAPNRTYRDTSPKPEVLVALEETWALCGFRAPARAVELLERLGVPELDPLLVALRPGGTGALRAALDWLLHLTGPDRAAVAAAVADAAAGAARGTADPTDPADPTGWVHRLAREYPGDPSCIAPLLLELVRLGPGESVHLPAGNLHAYLRGAGIEIMASSDNVLRGGLTPKHIDVDELLTVLRFEPGVPPGPRCSELDGITTYDAAEPAFALARVRAGDGPVTIDPPGASLLLATGGAVDVAGPDRGIVVDHGDAVFVAPGTGPYAVDGPGTLWWATVGDALPAW